LPPTGQGWPQSPRKIDPTGIGTRVQLHVSGVEVAAQDEMVVIPHNWMATKESEASSRQAKLHPGELSSFQSLRPAIACWWKMRVFFYIGVFFDIEVFFYIDFFFDIGVFFYIRVFFYLRDFFDIGVFFYIRDFFYIGVIFYIEVFSEFAGVFFDIGVFFYIEIFFYIGVLYKLIMWSAQITMHICIINYNIITTHKPKT